ncbi:MAG: hypothetical protein ISQ66_06490, partial [Luminiphilus sp.]|nr:hypothetical protein [Luminiphilus sp.]
MAHTRRPSARHGLPLLTLILIGVGPLISVAQDPSDAPAETEAAPIVIDMAAPLEPERAPPPPTEPSALGVYRGYIESMETNAGAFAPGLTEHLLGLGLNLQALDRHAEAAKVLKRGVHVSRVQSGLYAADQIPLLRAEIRSHIALGQFDEADEHQRYLARVESEALTGTPASIAALIDQGEWAEQAWDLRLGDQEAHPEHLARSWEYYRLAYNQSTQLYGERSLELVKPLEGMLRLQYRFADLQRENASNSSFDGSSYRQTSALGGAYRRGEAVLSTIFGLKMVNGSSAGEQARDLTRLGDWARWMGRRSDARSYYDKAWRRITPPPVVPEEPEAAAASKPAEDVTAETAPGAEVAMSDAGAADTPPDTANIDASTDKVAITESEQPTAVEAQASGVAEAGEEAPAEQERVAQTSPAKDTEQSKEDTSVMALPEEQPPEDDPVMRAALFETATPLPDIDTLRPLPPFRRDASGPLVVQFQLNEAGKITVLERVTVTTVTESDTAEGEEASKDAKAPRVDNDPAVDRLLRKMRRTRFRPRYEEGVAVETGMIVWSFDLNPASAEAIALQP